MRTIASVLLVALLGAAVAGATGVPITPAQAPRHRAELVTLRGPVSDVRETSDGVVLYLGRTSAVPVTVPATVRRWLRSDPLTWRDRVVDVTGFVTPADRPLGLTVDRAESVGVVSERAEDPVAALRARVAALERELDRLAPRVASEADGAITIGSTRPLPRRPIPLHSTENTVLGERGVPTRVEWTAERKVLYYGRERWLFDADGQLVDVRHD